MKKVGILLIQWVAAVILLQTLWFKFTASPESVYIFSRMGIEPWGRIASGIAELIAAILLILPKTRLYGAIMAFGIMFGALVSHLAVLGIEVRDDGGLLFLLALVVWICSLVVILADLQKLFGLLNQKK